LFSVKDLFSSTRRCIGIFLLTAIFLRVMNPVYLDYFQNQNKAKTAINAKQTNGIASLMRNCFILVRLSWLNKSPRLIEGLVLCRLLAQIIISRIIVLCI
jgi:hypothetical protein